MTRAEPTFSFLRGPIMEQMNGHRGLWACIESYARVTNAERFASLHDGAAELTGLTCRLYSNGSGVLPREALLRAISNAKRTRDKA